MSVSVYVYNIFLPFFVFVPGCESCQSDGGWWFHLHCSQPLHKLQGCPGERQDAVRFCCEEMIAWWSDFPLKKKKRKKNAAPAAAAALRFVACNIMSDMVWFVIVYCGLQIRSYKATRSLFLFIQVGTGVNQFIFFQREMHLVACGIYLAARVCAIYLKPNINSLVC